MPHSRRILLLLVTQGTAIGLVGDYRGTTFIKPVLIQATDIIGTSSGQMNIFSNGGFWLQTSAIVTVTVFLDSGAGFSNNSVVSLYGSM